MAFIQKDSDYMGLPMNILRGNPVPLDTTEVWYSLEEAQTYARTGVTAYVGQRIVVVDEQEGNAEVYVIKNLAGDLMKLSDTEGATLKWGALGSN